MTKPAFEIAGAFRNKAIALRASFLAIRDVTSHPTERGDQAEADWAHLMSLAQEAVGGGASEYAVAEWAGVPRSTVRGWLGKR